MPSATRSTKIADTLSDRLRWEHYATSERANQSSTPARRVVHSARFGVDVLPGHPSMSIFEDLLSEAWAGMKGGEPAGARKSMWLRTLRDEYAEDYDLIVVDVSPSLDAINRSALLGSDTFVTPMAPDLFSPYALDNITAWLRRWLGEYNHGRGRAHSTGMAANLRWRRTSRRAGLAPSGGTRRWFRPWSSGRPAIHRRCQARPARRSRAQQG
jgi:cellulose biosynthesis protein BcsQ